MQALSVQAEVCTKINKGVYKIRNYDDQFVTIVAKMSEAHCKLRCLPHSVQCKMPLTHRQKCSVVNKGCFISFISFRKKNRMNEKRPWVMICSGMQSVYLCG